jgi:hypothetical protein
LLYWQEQTLKKFKTVSSTFINIYSTLKRAHFTKHFLVLLA